MWSDPSFLHFLVQEKSWRRFLAQGHCIDVVDHGRVVTEWQENVIHPIHVLKHRLFGDICCHILGRSGIRNWLLFIWGQAWPCSYLGSNWLGRTRPINWRTTSSFHSWLSGSKHRKKKKKKSCFVFSIYSYHLNSLQPMFNFLHIGVCVISELSQ